ncbi:hypothetical protein BLGI_2039 [Brevibacillus laterosporus GI-9]|nr:hypothetical protein BLGI_2039 [Brevibacillus laterosporus GI-9]
MLVIGYYPAWNQPVGLFRTLRKGGKKVSHIGRPVLPSFFGSLFHESNYIRFRSQYDL